MTQDDKDLLLGKTLRQYKEAGEQLAMLKAEAANIGAALVGLGHTLKAYPEFLIQEHEAADERFLDQPQTTIWKAIDVVAPERIKKLTSAIRQQALEVSGLRKRLRDMGQQDV